MLLSTYPGGSQRPAVRPPTLTGAGGRGARGPTQASSKEKRAAQLCRWTHLLRKERRKSPRAPSAIRCHRRRCAGATCSCPGRGGRGPLASGGQGLPSLPRGGTVCEAPASRFPSRFPAKPLGRRQPPSERPEPPRENRWLRVWRVCVPGTSHVITASDGGSVALFL